MCFLKKEKNHHTRDDLETKLNIWSSPILFLGRSDPHGWLVSPGTGNHHVSKYFARLQRYECVPLLPSPNVLAKKKQCYLASDVVESLMKKRNLPNCFVFLNCPHYYLALLPFSFSQVPSDRQEWSVVESSLVCWAVISLGSVWAPIPVFQLRQWIKIWTTSW